VKRNVPPTIDVVSRKKLITDEYEKNNRLIDGFFTASYIYKRNVIPEVEI